MKKYQLLLFVLLALVGMTACTELSQEKEIAILSVNDMHSSIDRMPQLATLVDSLRGIYPELLVVSAGDNRTGNPVNDQYKPSNYPMTRLMNEIGFNASAVGNHEFDANITGFQTVIDSSHFPYVCANILIPDSVKLDVKPYVMIENQGVKIGFIGAIQQGSNGKPDAHPANLEKVSFVPASEAIQKYTSLRNECDVMILLSHCGFEQDMSLAEEFPCFDEIIGGHSHTLVDQPSLHNGVLVTQSGAKLSHATLSLLKVKDGKVIEKHAQVLEVANRSQKDADLQALVDDFNNVETMKEVLAVALTDFGSKQELGCMMTDGIRAQAGADFAFQNTGGVRISSFPQGDITIKDVYTIDPFNNSIVLFTMNGQEVKNFIMASYKENKNHPSYVSGMNYQVKLDKDGNPVDVNIDLKGEAFKMDKQYKVAMNDYMASTIIFDSADSGTSLFRTSEEMLIDYLREQKTVSYNGIKRVSQK